MTARRVAERLPQLALNRGGKPGQRQFQFLFAFLFPFQRPLVETFAGNFSAKPRQHVADRVRHRRKAVALGQRLNSGRRRTSSVDGSFWKSADLGVIGTDVDYDIARIRRVRGSGAFVLQRVHVGDQVFDLLVRHDLAKAFHLRASIFDDVRDALIVRGQSAE